MKTKVHTPKSPSASLSPLEKEKIFLEVHIQNLTQDAICFERMRLECTDSWTVIDGNNLTDENETHKSMFSESMALMQPQDMRQYVYILTPKNIELFPPVHTPGSIIPLGRLDISWRSSFGEPGRLLTSMLSRRIPLAPVAQPASALPSYLKRSIASSSPSRPHSPSLSQSRPGTPPRPGSPAIGRASISSIIRPQSPQQPSIPPSLPLPELEVQLLVRSIPRQGIQLEKPFSISFSAIISSGIPPPGKGLTRRRIKLAIQHTRPRTIPPPTSSQPVEALSPRIPSSSGFSTPSSAPTTFNYALAHQKILAASSQLPAPEPSPPDDDMSSVEVNVLPPPYFEGGSDDPKHSASSGVSFLGPSTTFLPMLDLLISNAQTKGDAPSKIQAVQDFNLSFVGLRKGFSTIGGMRILLVDDHLTQGEQEEDDKNIPTKRAHILREYAVVGEVWVSS